MACNNYCYEVLTLNSLPKTKPNSLANYLGSVKQEMLSSEWSNNKAFALSLGARKFDGDVILKESM